MWFDPACPWAWLTSRWLKEVEKVRDVRIDWRVMSLSVLNEGRDLSPDYLELMAASWGPVRVITGARRDVGDSAVLALYDAMGTLIHHEGVTDRDEVIAQALTLTGLPADLARYAHSDEVDDLLRAGHQEAIDLVGDEVGTPVVAFGDIAFFGPVIAKVPTGEAAGRLWDGCLLVAGTEHFYELKRTRTVRPILE